MKSIGLCNPDKWQSAFTVNLADKVYKVLTHPFRRILDATAMAQLIEIVRHDLRRGEHVRFPAGTQSAYLREREERAEHLRQLIMAGARTSDIARAVRVTSRTVGNHRARLRREGLSPQEVQS